MDAMRRRRCKAAEVHVARAARAAQVVCAGVKSVLDIPRTLEFLETQGVCVAAYGVDEFPAFFTRHSGCATPCRMESPEQVAAAIEAGARLGLGSGMVLGAWLLLLLPPLGGRRGTSRAPRDICMNPRCLTDEDFKLAALTLTLTLAGVPIPEAAAA